MKSKIFLFITLSVLNIPPYLALLAKEKPFRPATANRIPEHNNPPPEPQVTAAEKATPPPGEIQKIHLRAVNNLRTILTTTLATVPEGAEGQESPWFTKAQAYKLGLDVIAASSLQSDCIALIPQIAGLLAARETNAPEFARKCAGLANGFSTVLINAIERHIIDQNATVSAANLASFCTVFSVPGFTAEGDWETLPIPVDAAGVMILDAAAVGAHLKTRPWEEADWFLGNSTSALAFERYGATGDGMEALKTKYAANQATITAKWNELAAWVESQRPPN